MWKNIEINIPFEGKETSNNNNNYYYNTVRIQGVR